MSAPSGDGVAMETMSPEIVQGVVFYVLCSGFMLIANKLVITLIPAPAFVFCIQLASAVAFIFVGRAFGLIRVDTVTHEKVKGFLPYIVLFVISVYCNGRALAASNAETVIVFRASTPLFVSAMDVLFLGREIPARRSLSALVGVVIGAFGYMQTDSEFQLNGVSAYFWVIIYTIAIVLEMTYGKVLLGKVKFDTPVWGSVMFTNALGLPPMVAMVFVAGEVEKISTLRIGMSSFAALMVSCAIGIGIGWTGWNCRGHISATSFTLVGVVCKLITVIVNVLIWNKHASPAGIGWLLVCLASSSFYQQAPLATAPKIWASPGSPTAERGKEQNMTGSKLGNIWNGSGDAKDGLDSDDDGATLQ